MTVNPRKTAADMVYNVLKGSNLSDELEKMRAESRMTELDARFTAEIVNGVLRKKEFIDCAVSNASNIKINKISPYALAVIRCGTYQILFMDKVPDSAAVNESVKLIRKANNPRLGGFVNAVLRTVAKNGMNISFSTDKIENMSVRYSCPKWITQLLCDNPGDEAEMLLRAMGEKPLTYIRANKLKTTADELTSLLKKRGWECERYFSDLFSELDTLIKASRIEGLTEIEEFKNGMFYVQDAAASYAAYVLAPEEDNTVIDMCAAPGGKTTHISELMNNTGRVYAFDIYDRKIDRINENAKRLGITNIIAEKRDAAVYEPRFKESADRILVDSPCSGLGIIRKKPDIKYQRKPEDIKELSQLSLKILLNAAEYLKKGGRMVFSTCTLTYEENCGVLFEFLKRRSDFKLKEIPCSRSNEGYITLYPHTDGCDGFFISLLEKE